MTVYWHMDNEYMGETREIHYMEFNPSVGKHRITLVDEAGETVTRMFEIVGGT